MSQYSRLKIAALVVLSCLIPAIARQIVTRSPSQLDRLQAKAAAISVRIDGFNPATGVIVGRSGTQYWVLTARHAIETQNIATDRYRRVVTTRGNKYRFDRNTVCYLHSASGERLDLALFRFESDQTYDVAEIATYTADRQAHYSFIYGWPDEGHADRPRSPTFVVGQIVPRTIAIGQMRFQYDAGYTLFYSNPTEIGMSGGAVIDAAGRLVGIHGREDGQEFSDRRIADRPVSVKLGLSSGIPMSVLISALQHNRCASAITLQLADQLPPKLSSRDQREFIEYSQPAAWPNSDRPVDWSNAGNHLYRSGQLEAALAHFDRAIALQPAFFPAWFQRGNTLYAMGRESEALTSFDQALAIEPTFYQAWRDRGALLVELGNPEAALVAFEQAIALRPDDRLLWYLIGNLLALDLGRPNAALAAYDQAIALNDRFAPAWFGRGRVLSDLGRLDEAIAALDRGLALDDEIRAGWLLRAEVWQRLGNGQQAKMDLERAGSLRP